MFNLKYKEECYLADTIDNIKKSLIIKCLLSTLYTISTIPTLNMLSVYYNNYNIYKIGAIVSILIITVELLEIVARQERLYSIIKLKSKNLEKDKFLRFLKFQKVKYKENENNIIYVYSFLDKCKISTYGKV